MFNGRARAAAHVEELEDFPQGREGPEAPTDPHPGGGLDQDIDEVGPGQEDGEAREGKQDQVASPGVPRPGSGTRRPDRDERARGLLTQEGG